MTETLRGIEKLHPTNHELYRLVQKRVAAKWTWAEIATDVGLAGPRAVKELTEWVLAYKHPKRLPMVRAAPLTVLENKEVKRISASANAQRFIAWKRANDGARKTLEAMEK